MIGADWRVSLSWWQRGKGWGCNFVSMAGAWAVYAKVFCNKYLRGQSLTGVVIGTSFAFRSKEILVAEVCFL